MPHEQDDVLKVGDIVEFHIGGNPKPVREWDPQVVTEIRVVEDGNDKEGVSVSEIGWRAIRDYECIVIVVGTENWARNDQLRPVSKVVGTQRK